MAHNYYQQPGGEDRSFAAEADVLERHGHSVHRFTMHNDSVKGMGKVQLARATIWNKNIFDELRDLFRQQKFHVAHFQNTFPLISPAAYYAAQEERTPVIQHLRNYRLACPNALFFRDGHVCEDCMGKAVPWPGVVHGCYRDSKVQSAAVATMLTVHRARRTWTQQVDKYITLSEFARQKFIETGIPAEKIVVKPNFLQDDPGVGNGTGEYMLFVGRMVPEKGVWTVLKAWQKLGGIPIKMVGDGPIFEEAQAFVQQHGLSDVELTGRLTPEDTLNAMKNARCVIVPSEWYEPFGRVAVEAFAVGTPVIASKIGAITELVENDYNGLHFTAADPADLAAKVEQVWADPQKTAMMGKNARQVYEEKYTAERNYAFLKQIYDDVIAAYSP